MPTVGGSLSSYATSNTAAVVDITSIPDGAWMIATLMQAGSYQTALPPAGWTNLLTVNSQLSGTRAQAYAGRIKQSGDTSVSWGPEFTAQTGGRRLAVLWGEGGSAVSSWVHGLIGVRSATNVVSGIAVQAGTGTTSIAPSVTVPVDDSLVIAVLSEATTNAGTFTVTSGATGFFSSGDSGTIEFIVAGSFDADAGATTQVVATGSQTQASNGQGIQIAIPPAATTTPYRGYNTVAEMLATPGFTWAHRGLTTYAEESLHAYTQAVNLGHGALEFSMGRTSDGVWFGTHDNTLNRVVATTGLPAVSSMTWAQVQTYTINIGSGAPKPFLRWEELRDTYGDTHVLILDPKNYNWGTYQTEFLNMCDQLGTDRVIVKQYASDMGLAAAAAGRGYTTWGHTFDDFMADPNLNTYLAGWDLLGIDYSASQANWNVLLATGKPVVGHVADNQTAYNTSMSKGASGVQCTSASIAPVSWWNSSGRDADSSLALVGSASATVLVARVASGVLVLSGSGSRAVSFTRTATATLTVNGAAERATTVTRTATGSLELSGAASTTGGTDRTADGVLTVQGSAATSVVIARTAQGTLALGGIGAVTFQIVRTALGILALTGVGVTAARVLPDRLTLTEVAVNHTLTPVTVSHTLEDV